MNISHHQLSAFLVLSKTKNFSKAAKELSITQSALSQRISQLEADLETALIIREASGLKLTLSGEILLRYSQTAHSLEEEVLHQIKSSSKHLAGTVRIAGFSSVMRSIIIPSLSPFLRENSRVMCEFKTLETSELFDALRSSEVDFVISDEEKRRNGLIEHLIGQEEYVMVESRDFKTPSDVYLDHRPEDSTTEDYLKFQAKRLKKYRRSFMGNIYDVISGAEEGLGRAIVSKHLIQSNNRLKIIKDEKKFFKKIYLCFYEQAFYSTLHKQVIDEVTKNSKLLF